MLDPSVRLTTQVHAKLELTPDGQRVVDWANSLPKEQGAAVIKAFVRQGIDWTYFKGDATGDFNHWQAGNNPARYDAHTGRYFAHGEDDADEGVVICTDQTLLVAKGAHPPGSHR